MNLKETKTQLKSMFNKNARTLSTNFQITEFTTTRIDEDTF